MGKTRRGFLEVVVDTAKAAVGYSSMKALGLGAGTLAAGAGLSGCSIGPYSGETVHSFMVTLSPKVDLSAQKTKELAQIAFESDSSKEVGNMEQRLKQRVLPFVERAIFTGSQVSGPLNRLAKADAPYEALVEIRRDMNGEADFSMRNGLPVYGFDPNKLVHSNNLELTRLWLHEHSHFKTQGGLELTTAAYELLYNTALEATAPLEYASSQKVLSLDDVLLSTQIQQLHELAPNHASHFANEFGRLQTSRDNVIIEEKGKYKSSAGRTKSTALAMYALLKTGKKVTDTQGKVVGIDANFADALYEIDKIAKSPRLRELYNKVPLLLSPEEMRLGQLALASAKAKVYHNTQKLMGEHPSYFGNSSVALKGGKRVDLARLLTYEQLPAMIQRGYDLLKAEQEQPLLISSGSDKKEPLYPLGQDRIILDPKVSSNYVRGIIANPQVHHYIS